MTTIANIPGNWPRAETEDDLFIPPLRLRAMENPLTRNLTPYQTHEDEMSQGSRLYRQETLYQNRIATPYPNYEDEILETRSRRQQFERIRAFDEPPPYPTSPTDELFIPGSNVSTDEQIGLEPSRSPPPPIPVTTNKQRSIRPPNLQVENLMMQTAAFAISSPQQLGDMYLSSPISFDETTQLNQRSSQSFTSPGIQDELFLDCSSPLSDSDTHYNRESLSIYQLFEPGSIEEPNLEETDWKIYEPPAELWIPQDDTSLIIESILVPSIDRVRAQHEEEEKQIATARAERESQEGKNRDLVCTTDLTLSRQPLDLTQVQSGLGPNLRSRRVRVQKTVISTTEHSLDPSQSQSGLGLSISLATSLPSSLAEDSGFGSTSLGTENVFNAPALSQKPFGRFSSLFKRGGRAPGDQTYFIESTSGSENLVWNSAFSIPRPTSSSDTLSGESTSGSATTECVSCMEEFEAPRMVKLSCHSYCATCFVGLVSNALESEAQWPVKCCLNIIPSDTIITNINGPMKKKYRHRAAEWAIPAGNRIYCPVATCSAWIEPKYIDRESGCAKCSKCKQKTCLTCRGPFHNSLDCPSDAQIQTTIELAEIEGWKRCYSCHALVEHNKGCRHMTCRCKAQFCYFCGLRWRTCQCTEDDLIRVQAQADQRRLQQRNREFERDALAMIAAVAAEEERQVIAEVEEFIRQEAEREAQITEQERRIAAEERRKREETRIAAVNHRYHQFNRELDSLHDLQKIHIVERHEFERTTLTREHQNDLNLLAVRHPSEIETLQWGSERRIEATKARFFAEYQTLSAADQNLEEAFVSETSVFWAGRPEHDEKIRQAREKYRLAQDPHYRFWEKRKRDKLQNVRDEEFAKKDALMLRQKHEIGAAKKKERMKEAEAMRKRWAEMRWVEEIVKERVTMLEELEQDEYAGSEALF